MLLLGWQALVIGAHVHSADDPAFRAPALSALATPAAASGDRPAAPYRQRVPDTPATCPVCHAAAAAGHLLLPLSGEIVFPVALAFLPPAAPLPGMSRQSRSHRWHSRAPPLILPNRI